MRGSRNTQLKDFLGFAEKHFEALYRANPVQATTLGIHKYDDTLGDFSKATIFQNLHALRSRRDELQRVHRDKFPLSNRLDVDLVDADIQLNIAWCENPAEWKRNPNFYAELPIYGTFLLIVREFAPLEDRMSSVLARLREVPDVFQMARDNLENPPSVFTEVAIETAEGGIQFFERVVPQLAARVPGLKNELLSANDTALAASRRFLGYLKDELLPRSHGDFAVGKEQYEERLRVEHMLDISSAELAALGRGVFAQIEEDMDALAKDIHPGQKWTELIAVAKDEHPSGDELLRAYHTEIHRLRAFIVRNGLVTIPENERLEIVETPAFARSTLPYAAYNPPAPFESAQKGQFWVTPLETNAAAGEQVAQLREHSYYALPIIALHEAYPGHHVQLVRSNNVSSYIRKHAASNLMCEGWALYCEQLMLETGYVPAYIEASELGREKSMKLFRLFQLKDALWRSARIIVDVGLHAEGMTIDEAIRLLVDRVYLSEAAALAEVRRYTMSPTQPMSYMVGKLEILRMREDLDGIGLREFHDLLLSSGTIPLKAVRQELLARLQVRGDQDERADV